MGILHLMKMQPPIFASFLFSLLLLSIHSVNTHSTYNPNDDLLHYELLVSHPVIQITKPVSLLKRDVHSSVHSLDELNVNLVAFNRSYHFILTPELHLLHPDATVEVHHANDTVVKKPLSARIYKGHVVDSDAYNLHFSPDNLHASSFLKIVNSFPQDFSQPATYLEDIILGEVRLVLEHDGLSEHPELSKFYPSTTRKPIFHAHFDILGERYTVTPIHTYNAVRSANDPKVASHRVRRSLGGNAAAEATMLIYRDSDTRGGYQSSFQKRDAQPLILPGVQSAGGPPSDSCGSGMTKWNLDQRVLHALQYPSDVLIQMANGNFSALKSNLTKREPGHLDGISDYFSKLVKRQTRSNPTVRAAAQNGPTGQCLPELQFVYMGVATDCTYSETFQNSESAILAQLISVWGEVSAKYRATFNIGLGITNTVIKLSCGGPETWNVECNNSQMNILQRLTEFSRWRGALPATNDEGAWKLMSACNTGTTLGIAWTGTLCQRTATPQPRAADPSLGSPAGTDFVSSTGVSTITREQWKVVAHEIGHIFGAIHDCTSQQCTTGAASGAALSDLQCAPCTDQSNNQGNCDCGGKFLMNPTDSAQAQDFSQRSVSDMCSVSKRLLRSSATQTCLLPPGSRNMLEGNKCGNGILERGEECDCGANCATDACCGTDCKFKAGARCADSNSPGCCSNCQIKPQGSVCRNATEFCDLPEFCPGNSPVCPPDLYRPNGTPCSVNGTSTIPRDTLNGMPLTCASGLCTSRNLQCYEISRGQRATFSVACSSQQGNCATTCADSRGICYTLDNSFVDGTSCGFSNECVSGECSGFAPLNMLSSWVYSNTTVAIIFAVVIGISILACIYSCCIRSLLNRLCRRVRPTQKLTPLSNNRQASTQPMHQRHNTPATPFPVPPSAPSLHHSNSRSEYPPPTLPPMNPTQQMYNDQVNYLSTNVSRPYP